MRAHGSLFFCILVSMAGCFLGLLVAVTGHLFFLVACLATYLALFKSQAFPSFASSAYGSCCYLCLMAFCFLVFLVAMAGQAPVRCISMAIFFPFFVGNLIVHFPDWGRHSHIICSLLSWCSRPSSCPHDFHRRAFSFPSAAAMFSNYL